MRAIEPRTDSLTRTTKVILPLGVVGAALVVVLGWGHQRVCAVEDRVVQLDKQAALQGAQLQTLIDISKEIRADVKAHLQKGSP